MRLWFTISLLFVLCSESEANNNLFLPGDAFFPTTLNSNQIEELDAGPAEEFVFTYSSLGGYEGAFCGYAGYERARLSKIDKPLVAKLLLAINRMRKFHPKRFVEAERAGRAELVETNPIRILIYPAEAPQVSIMLGLRYNENWVAECVKFGHKPQHVRLCCLIDDKDAIMQSWRDAPFVAGLKVNLPEVKLRPVPAEQAPITIEGPVRFYVLDGSPLIRFSKPKRSVSYLSVTAEKVIEHSFFKGDGWSKEELGVE